MNYLSKHYFIVSMFFVNVIKCDYKFFPNLPVGAYRIQFKGIVSCVPPSNNKIQFNFFLSKTSQNSTAIKGNVTSAIPFDDSLNMEINMSVKDSIGGWKDNAFIYKAPKACTVFKNFLGNMWTQIMDSLGYFNASCPLPAGIHIASGLDVALIEKINVPKTYFYGTYKFRLYYTKQNDIYGCVNYVLAIKRPWEMD